MAALLEGPVVETRTHITCFLLWFGNRQGWSLLIEGPGISTYPYAQSDVRLSSN